MPNFTETLIWFQEDKLRALEKALEQSSATVEQMLYQELEALYERCVPEDQRCAIADKLAEEDRQNDLEEARKAIEAYRVSAVQIVCDGACRFWKLARAWDILSAAAILRKALRQTEHDPRDLFERELGEKEVISLSEFIRLGDSRFQGALQVTGVYCVDFDHLRFSFLQPAESWKTCDVKDISTAIYQAERKSGISKDEKLGRFMASLEERGSAVSLPPSPTQEE